jgi:hypothetical protein
MPTAIAIRLSASGSEDLLSAFAASSLGSRSSFSIHIDLSVSVSGMLGSRASSPPRTTCTDCDIYSAQSMGSYVFHCRVTLLRPVQIRHRRRGRGHAVVSPLTARYFSQHSQAKTGSASSLHRTLHSLLKGDNRNSEVCRHAMLCCLPVHRSQLRTAPQL